MPTTKTNLNLRTGAGTGYSIVTTIPADSEVVIGPVVVNGDTWYPVTYAGKQGWVHGGYLDFGDAPGPPPTDTQTPYDDYVADAMALAVSMLGLYYKWGGNFTQEPFDKKRGDCSGYVGFVSESMGYRPGSDPLYNYSANQMYTNFKNGTWKATKVEPGKEKAMDFVFYGTDTKVGHVVFAVGDGRVIGSSGGGSTTTSYAEAKRRGAKVRYDAINYRDDLIGIFRPHYGE